MTLFLFQKRKLSKTFDSTSIIFPDSVTATLAFSPKDAFGVAGSTPRTTFPAVGDVKINWNVSDGTSSFQGGLINPLKGNLIIDGLNTIISGNSLEIVFNVESKEELLKKLNSLNHILPPLISLRFSCYVYITQFVVKIANEDFHYDVDFGTSSLNSTTSQDNSQRIINSVKDWRNLSSDQYRIINALYYFRQAIRLSMLDPGNPSFASEIILNFTKSLEILFSSNRDRVRGLAKEWGFKVKDIEERIIPLFLIRNEIDIAHVTSGSLTQDERNIIVDFIESSIKNVEITLEHILTNILSNNINLQPISTSLRNDKQQLLQSISKYNENNFI